MSFQAMTWAVQQRAGSASAKLVLLVLANYADNAGVCWPSQERLAADTDMTDRSIRNAIAALEAIGLLTCEARRGTDGVRKTNVYRLALPENISDGCPDHRKKTTETTGNNFRSPPETVSAKPVKENQPLEPVKITGSVIGAFDGVLSDAMARAVVAHRKALKKPLTVEAAEALCRQFSKTPDPNAAAEMMLANGWQGFNHRWMQEQEARAAPHSAGRNTWDDFKRKAGMT